MIRCAVCGALPDDTDPDEHLVSDQHTNAVEIDAHLRATVYDWPRQARQ